MTSDALVTRGLTRRFGKRAAVSDLSLRVAAGDVYGFLGPNGAGKTTAIRCMLGLIRRDAGEVEIFGERDPVRQRRHVGALVETPAFHGWLSARANLAQAAAYAGLAYPREDADEALDRVGLAGRAGEKVRTYSLGMRQRLGIARALIGRPRLLLLDEPTNGLDPRGMKEVRDLLRELAERDRLTILVSSHLLGEVEQLCTRVGIIDGGRLVFEGDVDTIRGPSGAVDVMTTDADGVARALQGRSDATLQGPVEGGRLRVALGGLDAAGLNRVLVEAGVPVSALSPVERSLEELFLSLTSAGMT